MKEINLRELGEISRECSLQLIKNFSKLDILPGLSSTKKPDVTRGSFQFLRYDPLNTCFRTLPDAQRRFQDAAKAGVVSREEASALLTRLLEFCQRILPRYDGRFIPEISKTIAPIVRRAADLQKHGLPFEREFSPDELFSLIPWACRPKTHFAAGGFRHITVRENLMAAAKRPFTALFIGIDIVCVGPSAGLSAREIAGLLDLLEGKPSSIDIPARPRDQTIKTVLPSVSGGFQGITFANFVNLSDVGQHRVLHHLYQFGETIGQKCEEIRQQQAKILLDHYDGIHDVAKAFLTVLPPTEFIIVSKGAETIALLLTREEDYWAGYSIASKERLSALLKSGEGDEFLMAVNGEQFRLRVKLVDELMSLDPVLMRFRMKSNLARLTSTMDRGSDLQVLRCNDVLAVVDNLERQITDGVKPQAAAKALYWFEQILRNYEAGEARLHNDGCRQFMIAKLGKQKVSAYQLVGKASTSYQKLIRKFIQAGLRFEPPAGAILRVRWKPLDQALDPDYAMVGRSVPVAIEV